jgi:hypothetical protein
VGEVEIPCAKNSHTKQGITGVTRIVHVVEMQEQRRLLVYSVWNEQQILRWECGGVSTRRKIGGIR